MKQTITRKDGITYKREVTRKQIYGKNFTLRLSEKQFKILTKKAIKLNTNVTHLIRKIIEEYIGE